jgi:hypothetical protein
MTKIHRRLPAVLAASYALLFAAVLMKNVIWPIGDQTDVIRAGIAAFPLGLIMSLSYPGGRDGAFVAVAICGALNTVILYFAIRWFADRLQQ